MNPYERRLVHIAVREFPEVTSHSVGEGFLKQVTVAPVDRAGDA
jgi:spoIIIJ-associated protein